MAAMRKMPWRTWPVDQQIDFRWTYVAASDACVHTLLDYPALEGLPTQPVHRGDLDGDTINPAAND